MTDTEMVAFISNVLSINDGFSDPYAGFWEHIWWRTDGEYAPATFFVNCNDLFYWACADSETITPENFPAIKQAVDDVAAVLGVCDPRGLGNPNPSMGVDCIYEKWSAVGGYAADLFCARTRGMRPQRPCYNRYTDVLKPLFDACGPERSRKEEG